MSTSSPTINLDGRRLISIALLMAIIISAMSIISSVGAVKIIDDHIDQYAVPVGGTVLPAEIAAPNAISIAILLIVMVAAAAALTTVVFKWK